MKNDFAVAGDVTYIFLNRREGLPLVTLIDTADFARANEYPLRWFAQYNPLIKNFYAFGGGVGGATTRKRVGLHSWLLSPPKGMVVDHINHVTLDNRRGNLRIATYSENTRNRLPFRRKIKLLAGVKWVKKDKAWMVVDNWDGKYIGWSKDYDKAVELSNNCKRSRGYVLEGNFWVYRPDLTKLAA